MRYKYLSSITDENEKKLEELNESRKKYDILKNSLSSEIAEKEKIEKNKNGYRIWIPNQASVIKIFVPGYPLFEYNLPRTEYTYSVYIISLIAEKPDEKKDGAPAMPPEDMY